MEIQNSCLNDLVQLELLEKFPLFVPQNKQFTRYDGFLNACNKLWRLSLDAPNYPSTDGMQLTLSWELKVVLSEYMERLDQLAAPSRSVVNYLEQLEQILETSLLLTKGVLSNREIASCHLKGLTSDDLILSELRSLGPQRVSVLGDDLRSVSLVAKDKWDNIHKISLRISENYPESLSFEPILTVIDTDLPKAVTDLIQKEHNITAAYYCFCQQLHNLSPVWNELELLDSEVWVIDPTHPKKSDMYRRIFIDPPKVMAQITWNPLHPLGKPDIIFQGAESEVESFRSTYESHLEEWMNNSNILINMCKVLNLAKLPHRETSTGEINAMQETGECCICMSAELEGALPSVSCGQCLSCFHALCLFQWLEMMAKNRVVHNHISGDCPNCEAEIKCPDPNIAGMA